MNVEVDLETKEEKGLHFKKEFGKNMYLKSKQYENSMEDTEKTKEL
jgi:hypothetical protein